MSQQIKLFKHDYYHGTKNKLKQQKFQRKENKIANNPSRNSKENILKNQYPHRKKNNPITIDKRYKSLSLFKKQNMEKAYFQRFNFLKNQMQQKIANNKQQINPQIQNQYEMVNKKRKSNPKIEKIDVKQTKQSKKKRKQESIQKAKKKINKNINIPNIKEKKNQNTRKEDEKCSNYEDKFYRHQNNLKLKNFELKSQKNVNFIQKLNTQTAKQEQKKIENSKSIKPKSCYKRKVSKLTKQIQNLKSLSDRSEQVLQKMQKVRKGEQNKFNKQRQNYLLEIKKLEEQIKQYRPNIGHIFTYSEFNNGEIVPNELIPEGGQENSQLGLRIKQKSMYQLHRQCNEIMQKYLSQNTHESGDSEANQLCLSILSRQE